MKLFRILVCVALLTGVSAGVASDTLNIAPCDEAAVSLFGGIFTLSRSGGILRLYREGELQYQYSGTRSAGKLVLQDPLRPVLDEPDLVYVLDAGNNRVLAWDRFLNLHSVTALDGDIALAADFTVTSGHEWLIYDAFRQEILQVSPRENYLQRWGDRPVSGDIELRRCGSGVSLHLRDEQRLRIADNRGNTLQEYTLPDSLGVERVFPLDEHSFGLSCAQGLFLWEPQAGTCRLLSVLPQVVLLERQGKGFILINREGVVIRIP
jgi:hypothetical protein